MPNQPKLSEALSLEDAINAEHEAFDEARRIEEAQRYRNNPGPVVPPQTSVLAP